MDGTILTNTETFLPLRSKPNGKLAQQLIPSSHAELRLGYLWEV